MIECPACGRQHRSGTLFCSDCGTYMSTGAPLRTEFLPREDVSASRANPWEASSKGEQKEDKAPKFVRFVIQKSGRQVQLPVVSEMLVGRSDTAHGVCPDLDLTSDGGLDGGVSRRHAKIHYQDDRFFVEDLGSANGTFVNEERITPYLLHPLQSGDELFVGKVELLVEFEYG